MAAAGLGPAHCALLPAADPAADLVTGDAELPYGGGRLGEFLMTGQEGRQMADP